MPTFSGTFRKSHPWLKFSADFREAPATLWIMLGECQSKCAHIAGVPMRPDTAERLHQLFLAKGALATTAIEGNTLSEEEVIQHLQGKLQLPPSREYLAQEISNIVVGCNDILKEVAESGKRLVLSPARIAELNRRVLDKLTVDEGVIPGQIRKDTRGVARYKAPPPSECERLLNLLCDWLNGDAFTPSADTVIAKAILKAILAHLYLTWIHPFGDGNGRTARLLEFEILIHSGVPAPAAQLLSNHYNQTRAEYYRILDQASRSGGDVLPFVTYAVRGFLDGLRSQLEVIRKQQLDVVWRNFVHEKFRDKTSPSDERRRHLVLDLSANHPQGVPLSKLTEVSNRVTKAYALKTPKTLARDVNTLIKMGLIEKDDTGIRACSELILAFLPFKADSE